MPLEAILDSARALDPTEQVQLIRTLSQELTANDPRALLTCGLPIDVQLPLEAYGAAEVMRQRQERRAISS